MKIKDAELKLSEASSLYAQQVRHNLEVLKEKDSYYKSELLMQQTEVDSLTEFSKQKDRMEEDLRMLEETLERNRYLHQETMEQLESKILNEQESYEKDLKTRIQIAEEQSVFNRDEQLEAQAVKTMQEHMKVNTRLKKTKMNSKEIYQSNVDLLKKLEKLTRENQLSSDREQMLNVSNRKIKTRLENTKKKIADIEVAFVKERARLENEYSVKISQLQKEIKIMKANNENMKANLADVHERIQSIQEQQSLIYKRQSKYLNLLVSTNSKITTSLKGTFTEETKQPIQQIIHKLTQAIDNAATPSLDATRSANAYVFNVETDKFF